MVPCIFFQRYAVPFRLIFIKRFLTWWYHRKIKNNEVALDKLKKQKTKILDEIMETETYKVAKELLDEFASDQEKRALNVMFDLTQDNCHRSDFTNFFLYFSFQLIKSPAPQALSKNRTMMETPTKAPIVPNQSGTELRRRNTTQTVAQSATSLVAGRQMNPPSTSSSSTALGASFIQEKSNDSSPSKQSRPGPNVSRMIHNTSVVGRCT